MADGNVETYFEHDAWHSWVVGGEEVDGPYGSPEEAVAAGRQAARDRNVEHVVRNQQATIVEREDYGDDDLELSQDELRRRSQEGFVSRHGPPDPVG